MRPKIFGDGLIKLRAERGLCEAVRILASEEKTTASEFIRRELRQAVRRRRIDAPLQERASA